MSTHLSTGKRGERLAIEFLEKNGFRILETNYRFKRAEIDIIARDHEMLVFVEVKTKKSTFFGEPEEMINDRKIEMMQSAAEAYMYENGWRKDIRFDVIAILLGRNTEISHFKDAF